MTNNHEQDEQGESSDLNAAQSSVEDSNAPTTPQLSAIELRVLGALMEKQLTTPDAYPLTLNSIITACNQKSSRDPISHYEQGDLKRTLQILEDKHFVHREYGSRAEKYSQRFIKALELGKKQQALLCVMMLRGPQTLSELDTRTQRMCEFIDKNDLEHSIDRLCHRETPYAIKLGQQPGQRGERITHLFSGTPAIGARIDSAYNETPHAKTTQVGTAPASANTDLLETVELLTMEVAGLQSTVSTLENDISEIKKELAELYQLNRPDATEPR